MDYSDNESESYIGRSPSDRASEQARLRKRINWIFEINPNLSNFKPISLRAQNYYLHLFSIL